MPWLDVWCAIIAGCEDQVLTADATTDSIFMYWVSDSLTLDVVGRTNSGEVLASQSISSTRIGSSEARRPVSRCVGRIHRPSTDPLQWFRYDSCAAPRGNKLRLGTAFPSILDRRYPIVRPEFPLIIVLNLLRIQDLAAVPLTSDKGECRAVAGYSSLSKLVTLGHARFASFVRGPCGKASDRVDCFTVDQELEKLLDCFKSRGFGFVAVRNPDSHGWLSLATLADVIWLYESGLIKT